MISVACTFGSARIVAGQKDAVWMPRSGPRGKRAVVLCHGQLQSTSDWFNPAAPGQMGLASLLAGIGFVVIAADLNGPNWGHAESVADIDAIRTYVGGLGCATDKLLLVGASMGAYDALAYMATYPSRVAAMVGVIPAVDLDDIRDNNRGGNTQANVNTAWGLAAGSTSTTVPLPAGANVSAPAVAAAIATSGPVLLAYSTADTTVIPATVATFASRVGPTCTTIVADTTNGHSDTTIGLAAGLTSNGVNQVASFLAAAA